QQYVEILIFCVRLHGYRIRHYIIQQKLLHTLYKGFDLPEKSVSLSIIRLVKHIILNKDEFLIKYIYNHNLLDNIFEIYRKNSKKYNMISSACLELFEIIRKENLKKLITHFVDRFENKIKENNLQGTFEKMFIKYDQINDRSYQEIPTLNQEENIGSKIIML